MPPSDPVPRRQLSDDQPSGDGARAERARLHGRRPPDGERNRVQAQSDCGKADVERTVATRAATRSSRPARAAEGRRPAKAETGTDAASTAPVVIAARRRSPTGRHEPGGQMATARSPARPIGLQRGSPARPIRGGPDGTGGRLRERRRAKRDMKRCRPQSRLGAEWLEEPKSTADVGPRFRGAEVAEESTHQQGHGQGQRAAARRLLHRMAVPQTLP